MPNHNAELRSFIEEFSADSDPRLMIQKAISKLNLDLTGLCVLTEAATGNYIYSPLIPAFANASKVIAATRDSKYGSASDVIDATKKLALRLGVNEKIKYATEITTEDISEADIVTNSGFVRPITNDLISRMKSTAVISLMWETWEYREYDLDLRACWKKGIPVLGVKEDSPITNFWEYAGPLCMKILLEANFSIINNKILIIGDSKSTPYIVKKLVDVNADVYCITKKFKTTVQAYGGKIIIASDIKQQLSWCDAIIVNSFPSNEIVIGKSGFIQSSMLREKCPNVVIFQYHGIVDREDILQNNLICLPQNDPGSGHMGWTLSDLGPQPMIEFISAGLKVGELLARARLKGLSRLDAEKEALKHPICDDFDHFIRSKYGQ